MTCPICNQPRLRRLQRIPGGIKLHCKICGHVILNPVSINAKLKSIGLWSAGCLLAGNALKEAAVEQGVVDKPGSFEQWRVYTVDRDGDHIGWEGRHLGWCVTADAEDTGLLFDKRKGAEAEAMKCRTAFEHKMKPEQIMVEKITL